MRQAFRIGLESARINRLPMLFLWMFATLLVVAYYRIPAVMSALEVLGDWQRNNGLFAAFMNRVLFCGVLPGIFIVTIRALRPRLLWPTLLAQTAWSGCCGLVSDRMLTLHAELFGTGTDILTLAIKTAANQFVWVPLFFGPVGALVYFWIGREFSFRRVRQEMPGSFWWGLVMPNIVANWVLWIPLGFAVHAFPTPLQIQLTGVISAFFSLLLLAIGRRG